MTKIYHTMHVNQDTGKDDEYIQDDGIEYDATKL